MADNREVTLYMGFSIGKMLKAKTRFLTVFVGSRVHKFLVNSFYINAFHNKSMYIYEAFQNIIENKKNIFVIMVFFILGFTGIAVTDSLIYSTSQKAEIELSLSGSNIITVNLNKSVSEKNIDEIFSNTPYLISKSKKNFFNLGKSPYTDDIKMVMGTDSINISNRGIDLPLNFKNNIILTFDGISHEDHRTLYLNGLPFNIVGKIKKKETEFLDSLGLSSLRDNINYIIPLETMFRLTLDDRIDSIDIVKDRDINNNDIQEIKSKLIDNNVNDFSLYSILDAKEAVNQVLERFGLLTNTVYSLLTVMMLILIITVCHRTFQSRSTEFALKIIHGIDKKMIIKTVVVEMILITLVAGFLSVICALLLMYGISVYMGIPVYFRGSMIILSFFIVVFASYIVGIRSGSFFFKQNPIALIKSARQ